MLRVPSGTAPTPSRRWRATSGGSRAEGEDGFEEPRFLDQERFSGLAHEGRKPVGLAVKQEPVEGAFGEAFGVPFQEGPLCDPLLARRLLELSLELL